MPPRLTGTPLTGTPTDSSPYIEDHQARIRQIVNKYSSPDAALSASLATASPAVRNTAVTLDRDRVARGTTPYSQTETAIGMQAAQRNAPIVPRPDQPIWQDAVTDVTSFVQGIPKLPGLMVGELGAVRNVDLGQAFQGVSNPVEAIGAAAQVPGVRMLPGAFIAGAFAPGAGGVGELLDHPVYTALDVLPYASKAAKSTRTVKLAGELADQSVVPRETFGQLTPEARTPPIRTLVTKFQRGGPRVVPYIDDATGLEVPGAQMLESNRIGQAFSNARTRLKASGPGRFATEAHGYVAQEMMQGANRSTAKLIVDPIEQAFKGEKVDNLPAEQFVRVRKAMAETTLSSTDQQNLYREALAATDRAGFIDSLTAEQRAYIDPILEASDTLRNEYVARGELVPVEFPHGTEYLLPREAKMVTGRRDQLAYLRRLDGIRQALTSDGPVDAASVLENLRTSTAPNLKAHRAEIRGSLAALSDAGYDISALIDEVPRLSNANQVAAFLARLPEDVASLPARTPSVLDDTFAALKARRGGDRIMAEAVDRFERGDWSGARSKLKSLASRSKFDMPDIDLEAARAELKLRAGRDKALAQLDQVAPRTALTKARNAVDRVEARVAPQRFAEYIRSTADAEFMSEVRNMDLTPEQKLSVAEAVDARMVAQVSQIDGIGPLDAELIDLYRTLFADAKARWQEFAAQGVDPIYVHKVSADDVARMEHPFVLNRKPAPSALKRGVSAETFHGTPDLGLSVSHYAYEIMLRDASADFLNWVSGRFGVDAATVQARYVDKARAIAEQTGRPLGEVTQDLLSKDWKPMRQAEWMGSTSDIAAGQGIKPIRGARAEALSTGANSQVLIPADLYNNLERLLPKDPTTLGKVLSAPMEAFRTAVLPLSVRWHYNNILGNAVMYAVRANPLDMVRYAREAWGMAKRGEFGRLEGAPSSSSLKEAMVGRTVTKATKLPMAQRLAVAHTAMAGVTQGRLTRAIVDRLGPRGITWLEKGADAGARGKQWSYDVNQMFDDFFRSMAYLSGSKAKAKSLARELGVSVDEVASMSARDIERAGVMKAREILQNWDRMTPIERGFIKNVFPFYSWTSHILRYVGRLPADHPWRLSVMARFSETEYNDHLSGVPENLRRLFFIGNPDDHGRIAAFNTDSFNPFRDIGSWVSLAGWMAGQEGGDPYAVLSQLNPMIGATLSSIGVDPSRGPDLYPNLEYDPESGGLRASVGNLPLTLIGNTIPQLEGLSMLFGRNQEFSDLARTNPEAAGRMLVGSFGLPMPFQSVDMDAQQMKSEITAWRAMMADRSAGLRSGDMGRLEKWPALRQYAENLRRMDDEQRALGTPGAEGTGVAQILFSGLTGQPTR